MSNKVTYSIFGLLITAITIFSVFVGIAVFSNQETNPVEASVSQPALDTIQGEITDHNTVICGQFHEPLAVAGVPKSYSSDGIVFQDGYVLATDVSPSFFLGKYGAFTIFEREVRQYAIVTDAGFDLCATVREAINNAAPNTLPGG